MLWLQTKKFQLQGYKEHVEAPAAKCLQSINHKLCLGFADERHCNSLASTAAHVDRGLCILRCVWSLYDCSMHELLPWHKGWAVLEDIAAIQGIVTVVLMESTTQSTSVCKELWDRAWETSKKVYTFIPIPQLVLKKLEEPRWKTELHFVLFFSAAGSRASQAPQCSWLSNN